MKKFSKILSVALLVALVLSLGISSAFAAQTVGTAVEGKGSITINNAAKGETYKVTKVFDATITGDEGGSIAYLGDIPTGLTDYFEYVLDGNNNPVVDPDSSKKYVQLKSGVNNDDLFDALQDLFGDATGGTVCTDSPMVFEGLDYGYYVVSTSQGESAITVDSTNPDAKVYDKNTTTVQAFKTVEKESYSIGDTVKYTASFNTTNWMGEGEDAKQVTKYTISDTLPEFLSDVKVTAIFVDADGNLETTDDQTQLTLQQFDTNKKIVIPWADITGEGKTAVVTSKYPNGAKLVIKYEGKLTSVTNINTADTNTVTIKPTVWNGEGEEPWEEDWQKDAEIKTYAAALKKVDENGEKLAGATFKIKGLVVTGTNGEYTVVSYDPNGEDSEELATNADGKLYIVGLASDVKLSVTEFKAPDGYNKLTAPFEVTPQQMSTKIYKESGTIKYDAKGNVIASTATATTTETVTKNLSDLDEDAVKVENNKGTQLPSTGGIGTTIFYVVGGVLVLAAIILLVTKKRMSE